MDPATFDKRSQEIIKKRKKKWQCSQKYINWFLLEMLMTKEYWNSIEKKANLASPNQKWKSHMLSFLEEYLRANDLRYKLIPSEDIDDQRTLQSDWKISTRGHTQLKVVVSYASFHLMIITTQKLRHQFIFSQDVNDQRILQYDWTKSKPGLNQP